MINVDKECKKHSLTPHTFESQKYYRCLQCKKSKDIKRRKTNKLKLVQLLGGMCQLCGYNKNPRNLHFHHKDPKEKSFELSNKGRSKSFSKQIEEVRKCILVCANCHGDIEDAVADLAGKDVGCLVQNVILKDTKNLNEIFRNRSGYIFYQRDDIVVVRTSFGSVICSENDYEEGK